MNYMLFWLYIIVLVLTSFAVSFTLTYKLTDTNASNLYWILGGTSLAVWLMALVGIWFAIRPKVSAFDIRSLKNIDWNNMGYSDNMMSMNPY